MKLLPYSVIAGSIAFVAITAIVKIEQSAERRSPVDALDDTVIKHGPSLKAQCPTVDGGVAADALKSVDGGPHINASDSILENDSATCVRVGHDSTVNSTHGIRIGQGCPGGQTYPSHASQLMCASEGAKVIVDVNAGRP